VKVPKTWVIAGVVAIGAATLATFGVQVDPPGSGAASSSTAQKAPPLVSVVRAVSRDLPVKLASQGHVVSLNQVDVRSQASGTVRGVHFREGDEVKAGQLMFTIDASDVAAQLAHAEASAAQIEAQVDDAERQLARTRQLASSNFYSASAVDTIASKLESLQAQYTAARADVESTRVLVARTRIGAPITGLTGAVTVHPGSLAQPAAAAPLVTIVQIDPIGVEFALPETQLAGLLAARAAGSVHIGLRLPDGRELQGDLLFVNNTVNVDSGTITLKASFPNPTRTLWPGAYVQVQVDAGLSPGAIALPPQAVLEGPQGRFVYVLDEPDRASIRPVELLRMQDQMAVVNGLKDGERVVLEGQTALKPGVLVRVTNLDAKSNWNRTDAGSEAVR
jgi:RND family efflux transporter MFP subunit